MSTDLDATLAEAEQLLADDGDIDAWRLVEPIVGALEDAHSRADWQRVYALLSRMFTRIDRPQLAALVDAVAADGNDARAAYRLGHALIDERRAQMASGVLARALARHAGDRELRHELVASLELQGRYAEAVRVLEPVAGAQAPFLTRYLLAFDAIASGQPAIADEIVPRLTPTGDPRHGFMRARLDAMLRRQRFVGSARTPRASELVLSGALLLEDVAVDYREDSWAAIGANLVRLAAVLAAVDRRPPQVVSFGATNQNVVARAAATILGVPYVEKLLPEEPGIVVNHDLGSALAEIAKHLAPHRPQQLYYAHYAAAGVELPVCADVIGVRGSHIVSPWKLFTIMDWQRTDLPSGPPTGSDEELAEEIVRAAPRPEALADLPALVDFARRAAAAGVLALTAEGGDREKLWPRPID